MPYCGRWAAGRGRRAAGLGQRQVDGEEWWALGGRLWAAGLIADGAIELPHPLYSQRQSPITVDRAHVN